LSAIAFADVSKAFGATRACAGVSLTIRSGEFLTLLGDSGCGKTTLLRIVAGFTAPDAGRVLVDGVDVTRRPPADRGMGFVFQSYALFPTKTVAQNIAFALKVRGRPAAERRARVEDLAATMELDGLLDRFPHELSGGQQQRVALARALAPAPPILLLDEPLSALDARIRAKLRAELRALVRRLGLTAIYVTHDQDEALALSDRIAVMRAGSILQVDTPQAIYHRPASAFVARFVGTSNLVEGEVRDGGLDVDGALWPLPHGIGGRRNVTVAWRPEAIEIAPAGERTDGLVAEVAATTFLGGLDRIKLRLGGRSLLVDRASGAAPLAIGTRVLLAPDPARAVVLPGDAS